MMTYQQIKDWLKEKENKQKLVLGVCFVLVFLVGFGTGSYKRESGQQNFKPQSNYTTQPAKNPVNFGTNAPAEQGTASTTTIAGSPCLIKGNISSSGKKIYHVKGGAFYARVKPEQCFNTEAQALAAGFVKSSR